MEIRSIPGWEGKYSVTDDGKVFGHFHNRFLCQSESESGYLYVAFSAHNRTKRFRVHRLVMLAFVGPSSLSVNHKDGNKKNNTVSNLEYVTHSENMSHAYNILGVPRGPVVRWSALSPEKQIQIRQKMSIKAWNRDRLKAMSSVGVEKRRKIFDNDIAGIKLRRANGQTFVQIAKDFGVTGSAIRWICLNK